jgi:hypothetical protein
VLLAWRESRDRYPIATCFEAAAPAACLWLHGRCLHVFLPLPQRLRRNEVRTYAWCINPLLPSCQHARISRNVHQAYVRIPQSTRDLAPHLPLRSTAFRPNTPRFPQAMPLGTAPHTHLLWVNEPNPLLPSHSPKYAQGRVVGMSAYGSTRFPQIRPREGCGNVGIRIDAIPPNTPKGGLWECRRTLLSTEQSSGTKTAML